MTRKGKGRGTARSAAPGKGSLVVVESPAKARTLSRFLGKGFDVTASMGHVRDLAKKEGISREGGRFVPKYVAIKGKGKVLREIARKAKASARVFLAPDPDREGEAIAWHIREAMGKHPDIRRVTFHEITAGAVKRAFDNPGEIDMDRVNAQQARRILDRLVGFDVSELLWEKVARGLSAGRVQTVALRIVVEREAEIDAFVPEEYWTITGRAEKDDIAFTAKLTTIGGEKAAVGDGDTASGILKDLDGTDLLVKEVERKERRRNAPPPFITSTLQQEASRRLRLPVSRTMRIAQGLYEGVDLGERGTQGLITYMRTDSPRVSPEAILAVREFIERNFGGEYLPPKPNTFKARRSAQEAHEAIRPTDISITPDEASRFLDKDALALYRLVWSRFIASQCAPAVFDQTGVDLSSGRYGFRATGSVMKFRGFLKAWEDVFVEDDVREEEGRLPELSPGESLKDVIYESRQSFTQPPPRFTEATLVRELERSGIGRPSTYAQTIATIRERRYVSPEKGRLKPTELGKIVTNLLIKAFPDIFDLSFTAEMEEELDEIEEGKLDWQECLAHFDGEFRKDLEKAFDRMDNLKAGIATEHRCPSCSSPLLLRWGKMGRFLACSRYPDCTETFEVEEKGGGIMPVATPKFDVTCGECGRPMVFKRSRFGAFLACSGYPECRSTKPLKKVSDGEWEIEIPPKIDAKCPKCGAGMELKRSRFGKFLACSRYPECKGTRPFTVGAKCPVPGCDGDLAERRGKGGVFYSCTNYPKCRFRSSNEPVNEKCPACSSPTLFRTKEGTLVCAGKECGWTKEET